MMPTKARFRILRAHLGRLDYPEWILRHRLFWARRWLMAALDKECVSANRQKSIDLLQSPGSLACRQRLSMLRLRRRTCTSSSTH